MGHVKKYYYMVSKYITVFEDLDVENMRFDDLSRSSMLFFFVT